MVAGPEARDVAGVADDDRSHHRPDPVDLDDRCLRRVDSHDDSPSQRSDGRIETPKVRHELERLDLAFGDHAVGRADRSQHRRRPLGRQTPRETARNERSERRVEATGSLGAKAPKVVVASGQHAQDRRVVVGADLAKASMAQRGDRRRQRVVGIVLLGATRAQHPHSCRQSGRDIQHLLAGTDELLGQQVAQAACGLDGPAALGEPRRPGQQPLGLVLGRTNVQLCEPPFVTVDGDGVV